MIKTFTQYINENDDYLERFREKLKPIDMEVNWDAVENSQAARHLKNQGFTISKLEKLLTRRVAEVTKIVEIRYRGKSVTVDGIEFKRSEYAMSTLLDYFIYGNGQIKMEDEFTLNLEISNRVDWQPLGSEPWTTERMIRKFYRVAQHFEEVKQALLRAHQKRVDHDTSDAIKDMW